MNNQNVGTWWQNKEIDLVKIDNVVYALNGWNGEKYLECWICSGEDLMNASEEEYHIKPVFNENTNDFEYELV